MINIIIPCYNSRETLPKTLDSLVAQTQTRFLVTIVDDCSEENILDIVEDYNEKLHIDYIRLTENGGPGIARQAGIDANNMCDYLLFLDADDMLMPQAIEVLNRESQMHKPDILISAFIQQNKYKIDKLIPSTDSITWVHGKLYRASFLKEKNIRFPEGIRVNEDGAFNTMAFGMAESIYRTSTITMLWVDNKSSLTRRDDNFPITCLPSYIEGQIYAFNFLLDNEEEKLIDLSCGIVYMYNYYQVMISYNLLPSEDLEDKLKTFLQRIDNLEYFKDSFFVKNLIKTLNEKKNSSGYEYFETHTFKQWLELYGVILNENNLN